MPRKRIVRVDLRAVSPAGWVLVGLVAVGVALRVALAASWWPASTNVADSWPYSIYAAGDLMGNPQHPPGYSLLLVALGTLTRSLPVFIVLQQLMGIASALVLFAAVRRSTGSPWPALVPAAFVLLGADQIYLEHSIMSEGPFLLLVSGVLYAAVRALEASPRSVAWAVGSGGLLGAACVVRTAAVLAFVALVPALLLRRPRSLSWRPALAASGAGLAILIGYASVSLAVNDRFTIGPAPGWHIYSRVAPFADCDEFDPPRGTAALCERSAPAARPGPSGYLYDLNTRVHMVSGEPLAPGTRLGLYDYGMRIHANFERHDEQLEAFGRAAALAQPVAYASAVARDLARYWAPGLIPDREDAGPDLSPQLDYELDLSTPEGRRATERGMRAFFDPFEVIYRTGGTAFFGDYQRVFRFGATLLSLCTALILLGLFVGDRRSRVGVLLFGVGGILMLAPPVLLGTYSGRYTVPIAGMAGAGAAIGASALWGRRRRWQRAEGPAADPGEPSQMATTGGAENERT